MRRLHPKRQESLMPRRRRCHQTRSRRKSNPCGPEIDYYRFSSNWQRQVGVVHQHRGYLKALMMRGSCKRYEVEVFGLPGPCHVCFALVFPLLVALEGSGGRNLWASTAIEGMISAHRLTLMAQDDSEDTPALAPCTDRKSSELAPPPDTIGDDRRTPGDEDGSTDPGPNFDAGGW
jgi:hypothetical protein